MAKEMLSPWLTENTMPAIVRGGAGLSSANIGLPEGLRPPYRGPSIVDELRFTRSSGSNPIPLDLLVTITVGRQRICEDCPLDLLCRPLDFNLYKTSALSRTWKFLKPLFLPADGWIDVKARLTDPFSAESEAVTLTVAAVGRSLPEDFRAPAEIDVPFASKWLVTNTTGGSFQSTPSDLRNETRYPVKVERFSALSVVNQVVDDLGAAINGTVQLFGENGLLGVRDETPIGALAFYGRLSWMARSELPPNGYYTVDLEYTLPPGQEGPFNFGIVLVGSRRIPVKELGVDT